VAVPIDVDHVARLARLELTPDERERFGRQLAQILEHAERVGQVAAEDVPPTSHPLPRSNVLRDDEPRDGLTHDQAIANAPATEGGMFRVPRIVEQG
jgi:aspartyl-tRNA(Asn)/glutamyl-tRNA(Gln) amidotransferase subunit C